MKLILFLTASLFIFGCAKRDVDANDGADFTETAQQIGDVMASIDEAGGSGGVLAYNDKSAERIFARYVPDTSGELTKKNLVQMFQPQALAAFTCSGAGFTGCNTTTKVNTRTFNSCSVGSAIFDGTVTLTWTAASTGCVMQTTSDYVTRVPAFTVTGRRNATLTVSNMGTFGQKLQYLTGTGINKVFSFTSDGINRKFTSGSTILFNHTTQATSAITVTGTDRSNRVMSGGLLRVTNNLTSISCDYNPVSVTWASGCNCPVSGTWNGSCTDGGTSKLVLNGCGTGLYTQGSSTSNVILDRCGT